MPAVATDQASHRLQCRQMLLGEEAIASRAPWCSRDQAVCLVIADLLDTDVSGQCQIVRTQSAANGHVKLPGNLGVLYQGHLPVYHTEQGYSAYSLQPTAYS